MSKETIYQKLSEAGLSKTAVCAMMGNWQCESGLRSNNAEDSFHYTDKEYTDAVDNDSISATEFSKDDIGYGLAQWTFESRKLALYRFAKSKGVSISDETMQVEFAVKELQSDYHGLYLYLHKTEDLYEAVYRICYEYENPAIKNVSDRYAAAKKFYQEGASAMDPVEKYTQEAIQIANDNSHGYSQTNRNGNPDYDCSSLVCSVVQNAGIPVKTNGASYTGNMYPAFMKSGFTDETRNVNLATGSGLKRGDILLNKIKHTAIYLGGGQIVHARSDDGHSEAGDQTGREICTQGYWNYPWDAVLRYEKGGSNMVLATEPATVSSDTTVAEHVNNKHYPEIIKMGDIGPEVKALQEKLNALGFDCGTADGKYGKLTTAAVEAFQRANGLLVDGEAGPETLGVLDKTNVVVDGSPIKLGDVVTFLGGKQYLSANTSFGTDAKAGKATVTAIKEGSKHPYHLTKTYDGESNVYGWVDMDTIRK